MKNARLSLTILFSLLFCVSCALKPPDLSQKEKDLMYKDPKPYTRVTSYSEALINLGDMLATYGQPQGVLRNFGKPKEKEFVIQGRQVANKTACKALPIDITDMIKTAFGKVGGGIRYTQYDPQYMSNEYATGNVKMKRKLPVVVMGGAITECDEDIDVGATGIDGDIDLEPMADVEGDISAGTSSELGYSRLAMDLHLMNYDNSLMLSKKQTSIAIQVAALEKRKDFWFTIEGSGLGIDRVRKLVHGKNNAIRILVELSVLQLLGRLFEVPYWRLIPDAEEDTELVNLVKDNYSKASTKAQVYAVQYLLQRRGYQVTPNGQLDSATRAAINRYATHNGGMPPREIGPDLYAHLYFNLPLTNMPPVQTAQPPVTAPETSDIRPDSEPLTLHNAIVFSTRSNQVPQRLNRGIPLHSGDLYQFMLMPEETCYLYIFQADSIGQLYQLFPMESFNGVQLNNQNPVRGRTTVTLPGPDMNFMLDRQPGTERIYLIASRQPDRSLEELGRQLNQATDAMSRQTVVQRLNAYLNTKNGINAAAPGITFYKNSQGSGAQIAIDADKLNLSGNQVYVFEFEHR